MGFSDQNVADEVVEHMQEPDKLVLIECATLPQAERINGMVTAGLMEDLTLRSRTYLQSGNGSRAMFVTSNRLREDQRISRGLRPTLTIDATWTRDE